MQRIVAKYGAAAHLAFLAVAPLFLCPFLDEVTTAVVLLWLSLVSVLWLLMEPSIRRGEMLHVARRRFLHDVVSDPLFWFFLLVLLVTGIRALNTGVGMNYDAETAKWRLASAEFEILPGSAGSSGFLPFAGALSLSIVTLGCLHALGRSARMAFLLVTSSLGGLTAVTVLVLHSSGGELQTGMGMAFALYLLGGSIALFAAFDLKWRLAMPFFALAIGGTAAGAFACLPPFAVAAFAVVEVLVLSYVFFCSIQALQASGEFKLLVVTGIALTLGGLLVAVVLPAGTLNARISEFTSLAFFPEGFFERRTVLSRVAIQSWMSHLWIGTGLGSFPLDFRFGALAEDWRFVQGGVVTLPNSWLQLLAERGIVGFLLVVLPAGFLLYAYVRQAIGEFPMHALPHPACILAPVTLVVFVVLGLFDGSFLRVDVLVAACAMMSVAVRSFAGAGGRRHG